MKKNIEHIQGMPANFRDLGGIVTINGKHLKKERILRSGDLSKLTQEASLALSQEYHLKNILDLRTNEERKAAPDSIIDGTNYHNLDFYGNNLEQIDMTKNVGSWEQIAEIQDVEEVHRYMEKLYRSYVNTPSAREALKQLVDILLKTEEGSTLFHCFAGKDRTGISAAVILTILGVSKENIMHDYLETNKMRSEANKILIEQLRNKRGESEKDKFEKVEKVVETALNVDRRYLEVSYAIAEEVYGSFEQYIRDGIGVSEEKWQKLKEMYVEE